MITIPIWLFVIMTILAGVMAIILIFLIWVIIWSIFTTSFDEKYAHDKWVDPNPDEDTVTVSRED